MPFRLCLMACVVSAVRDPGPLDPAILTSTQLEKLMPYVGNGFLATHPIVGAEGGVGGAYTGNTVFLAGVFNGAQFAPDRSHRAGIPDWVTTVLPPKNTSSSAVKYTLNVEEATLTQRTTWFLKSGGSLQATETHYAHQAHRNLLVHSVELSNDGDDVLTVELHQAAGPDCGGPYGCDVNLATIPAPTGVRLVNGSNLESETNSTPLTVIAIASSLTPNVVRLSGHTSQTVHALSVFTSSLETTETASVAPCERALQLLQGYQTNTSKLLTEHKVAWQDLWENGIEVEGDNNLAATINTSMYFILSSIRDDWEYGLSPGGLASGGYHGHTFWDQETWMWPPLLLLQPHIAKSALQYRYLRQPGAAALANHFGHPGLRFPWESALTGVEAETGGGNLAGCSVYELHISGDICFAFWQYLVAQNSAAWLRDVGAPVIRGIATFFASRMTMLPSGKGYGILHAMGPDEYHPNVNNSAYVNSVAALSIRTAISVSNTLNLPVPANWSDIATGVFLDADPATGLIREYSGYSGQVVKQADAIMLGYPLSSWAESFTDVPNLVINQTTQIANLHYYANRTASNGPAMTWSLFSIGYLDAGLRTSAQSNFERGYANAQPPFYVWTETPTGGCVNFITGAGGFLQSVLFGYGGIRLTGHALVVAPPEPPGLVTELVLRGVHYLGWRLRVVSTRTGFTLTALSRSDDAVPTLAVALNDGQARPLAVGAQPVVATRPTVMKITALAPSQSK